MKRITIYIERVKHTHTHTSNTTSLVVGNSVWSIYFLYFLSPLGEINEEGQKYRRAKKNNERDLDGSQVN